MGSPAREDTSTNESVNLEVQRREEEVAHLKLQIKMLSSQIQDLQNAKKQRLSIDPAIKAKFDEKASAINSRNEKILELKNQLEQAVLSMSAASKAGNIPVINIPGINAEDLAHRILTRIIALRQENQELAVGTIWF